MERKPGCGKRKPCINLLDLRDSAFLVRLTDGGIGFPGPTSGTSGHRPPEPKRVGDPEPKPRPDPHHGGVRGPHSLPRRGHAPTGGAPKKTST